MPVQPRSADIEPRPVARDIGNFLAAEWGKPTVHAQAKRVNLGADKLNQVAEVKSGAMPGPWSVLAAAGVGMLRQTESVGVSAWSVAAMLGNPDLAATQNKRLPRCDQAPFKGSLAPSLGFDWRPGIRIDGPIALAVLGQVGRDLFHPQVHNEPLNAEARKHISQFQHACGIQDISTWSAAIGPDAAAFTLVALKSTVPAAARCLLYAWRSAIERHQELSANLAEDQKVDLLLALSAQFKLQESWTRRSVYDLDQMAAMETLFSGFFPNLPPHALTSDPTLTGASLRAALFHRLAQSVPARDPGKVLSIIEDAAPRMCAATVDMVQVWAKENAAQWDEASVARMTSTLDAWRLQWGTDATPQVSRTAKPIRV